MLRTNESYNIIFVNVPVKKILDKCVLPVMMNESQNATKKSMHSKKYGTSSIYNPAGDGEWL